MAVGAAPGQVLRLVVGQGLGLAAGGVVAGLGEAFALTRLLDSLLYGIAATDALTFAAAPAAVLFIVLLASLVPALREMRISPVIALRCE
jgi:putative ABC transport system permease protein